MDDHAEKAREFVGEASTLFYRNEEHIFDEKAANALSDRIAEYVRREVAKGKKELLIDYLKKQADKFDLTHPFHDENDGSDLNCMSLNIFNAKFIESLAEIGKGVNDQRRT